MVCACTPCEASTISKAPSQAAMERDTSYEKSTCPGVSIKFRIYFSPLYVYSICMAWLLMVIPLSFSRSMSSSICPLVTCIVLVNSSRRSAKVDLPWSIWAIMQKFRIFFIVNNYLLIGCAKIVKTEQIKKNALITYSCTNASFYNIPVNSPLSSALQTIRLPLQK